MGITLNQRNFLETRGFNVEGWTYEQASATISELKQSERGSLDYKPKTTYPKRVEWTKPSATAQTRVKEPFEAHLSIEQVRTNALNVALALTKIPNDERVLLEVAKNIEQWILTGKTLLEEKK